MDLLPFTSDSGGGSTSHSRYQVRREKEIELYWFCWSDRLDCKTKISLGVCVCVCSLRLRIIYYTILLYLFIGYAIGSFGMEMLNNLGKYRGI